MPNFEAKIRVNYKDVDNLVLDCISSGLELDGSKWTNSAKPARRLYTGSHTGSNNASTLTDSTKLWVTNQLRGCFVWNITDGSRAVIKSNTENTVTATLSGGTDNDWDTGDNYVITTYRIDDPIQPNASNRPTINIVSGFREAQFDRGSSNFLRIPIDQDAINDLLTISYEYTQYDTAANDQSVLGFPNLKILRTNGSGNFGYKYNVTEQVSVGDMATGQWMLIPTSTTTAQMYQNNSSVLSGTFAVVDIASGIAAGYIGCSDGATDFCSCKLRGVQIWNRRLTALERDFVYKTINTTTEYQVNNLFDMTTPQWRDLRDGALKQRINPSNFASHRFILGSGLTNDVPLRIQIACTVGGFLLPDTDLDGNLFGLEIMEAPSGTPAVISQDTGYSAIFDVLITEEGHYTFFVSRPSGGATILHFDAEINTP